MNHRTKRDIIATLLRQGRPELVKAVVASKDHSANMTRMLDGAGRSVELGQSSLKKFNTNPQKFAPQLGNVKQAFSRLESLGRAGLRVVVDAQREAGASASLVEAGNRYWSGEVNKGLEGWWQELFHSVKVDWESIKWERVQQGGGGAFWFRQISGTISSNDENFTITVKVSPTSGNTKLGTEVAVIAGFKKGAKKTLPKVNLGAAPYEIASMVNAWLVEVFKESLASTVKAATEGYWLIQKQNSVDNYAFVIGKYGHGGDKALVVAWWHSDRVPKKASTQSTRNWRPPAKPIKASEVPREVVERVEDKIGSIQAK